jgi:aspartate aminotransferase-like enzyme
MWAGFAESYGLTVHRICTEWTRDVDASEVDAFLASHPAVRAVALTYGDTSTGVLNDVASVARVVRARNVLTMVDGVSTLGGTPLAFDEWELDFAVTASQKCLMSSPGLAFVALSERAWAASARARLPRNYWDFRAVRENISKAKPETPGTTPVHLVLQVAEALRLIHEEGLPRVFARHAALGERTRAGAAELGLALQCPALRRFAPTLTAIALPAPLAPKNMRDAIKTRGILTAAGLGPYVANAFRIGHMGDIRVADVERTLLAVREAIAEARAA